MLKTHSEGTSGLLYPHNQSEEVVLVLMLMYVFNLR